MCCLPVRIQTCPARSNQFRLSNDTDFPEILLIIVFPRDEAHTRGTDLKMPSNYRAIVTLGPDLTQDRLAQGKSRG